MFVLLFASIFAATLPTPVVVTQVSTSHRATSAQSPCHSGEVGRQLLHDFAKSVFPAGAVAGADVDELLKKSGLDFRAYPVGAVGHNQLTGTWLCEGILLMKARGKQGYAKYTIQVRRYGDNMHVDFNAPVNDIERISRQEAERLTGKKLP